MLLEGKNAVITGCSRGIGRAVLEQFAIQGADVAAHARKPSDEHEAYCDKLSRTYHVNIYPVYFDMTSEDDVKRGVRDIAARAKHIDILVNNAGVVKQVQLFQMTTIEGMKEEFDVNFFSQMYLTQMLSRMMIRSGKGSIINISSCAGLDGNTGMIGYVSSKAAVIGATKRLAIELGNYNIRVNSVAPGLTDTDMGGKMREDLQADVFRRLIIKRKAAPKEIADAVVFLASDMSSFITGQVLRVDGGMLN